jgi:hypothetical protein
VTTILAVLASSMNEGQLAPPPWEVFLVMAIIGNFDAFAASTTTWAGG